MSLHIYKDAASLAEGLASWIAGSINLRLKQQPRFSFVLSGGSTPKRLYEILAAEYADKVNWEAVDFFWGDERHVPYEDDRNNGRMAYESLLQPLGISNAQIFMMPTDTSAGQSATAYEGELRAYLRKGAFSFDLALLGMGTDAHTLSVFPDSPLIGDEEHWVRNVLHPKENLQRITLMPSLVNRSAAIVFMVSGSDKSEMLRHVLKSDYDPQKYPAQLIHADSGSLQWFVDEDAAQSLLRA